MNRIVLYILYGCVVLALIAALTYVDDTGLHVYTGIVQLLSLIIGVVSFIAGRLTHDKKTSDTRA